MHSCCQSPMIVGHRERTWRNRQNPCSLCSEHQNGIRIHGCQSIKKNRYKSAEKQLEINANSCAIVDLIMSSLIHWLIIIVPVIWWSRLEIYNCLITYSLRNLPIIPWNNHFAWCFPTIFSDTARVCRLQVACGAPSHTPPASRPLALGTPLLWAPSRQSPWRRMAEV